MLNEGVQIIAHHLRPWRSKYAPGTKAPRAELHCASKPSNDSILGEQPRYLGYEFVFGQEVFVSQFTIVQNALDFLIVKLRAEKGVSHLIDTFAIPEYLVDRKSTRLNSSHLGISYAVFCLK